MMTFFDAVRLPIDKVEATRVSCGTCPVNLSCVVGQGGNGWKFDCCGSSGYVLDDVTLVVDCANNGFEQLAKAKEHSLCPLCSGGIMEVVERAQADGGKRNLYLLTEHTRVPIADRIELWKRRQLEAQARIADERARKTA